MTSKSIFLVLLLVPFFQLGNMIEVQAEEIGQSDFILEDVFFGNENLVKGSKTKIWAVMKNMGTVQPNDSIIAFYVNDILFDEKSIQSKPKGYSVTANTKSWEYPGGIVNIKACADPNNTFIEKNEDNNCLSIQFPTEQEFTTKPGSEMIVSTMSINVTTTILEGDEASVTIKGKLADRDSGIGISGKSILVTHPKNNVKVVTDSEGYYSHTFSMTSQSSTWNVSASFSGDKLVRASNAFSALHLDNTSSDIEESPPELPIIPEEDIPTPVESPLPEEVTTPIEPTLPDEEVKVTEFSIPQWVKNTVGSWSERAVADSDFSAGISYLIEEEIISIRNLPTAIEPVEDKVPEWVRIMAGWWADELTTDLEFANAIKFLVERGIVQVQA